MLYCPIHMACDILQPRWTIHILTELSWGATRFNEIRRGIPGISPTLLAKRLKTLQSQGLVERVEDRISGSIEYFRTDAATELEPIVTQLGKWAYRNTSVQDQTCKTEPGAFVWNIRQNINTDALPNRRVVMKLAFPDQESDKQEFWIMCRPGFDVDVCFLDPGFDVDLHITADFEAFASVFYGYSKLSREIENERINLIGQTALANSMDRWLVLSSYAQTTHSGNA